MFQETFSAMLWCHIDIPKHFVFSEGHNHRTHIAFIAGHQFAR